MSQIAKCHLISGNIWNQWLKKCIQNIWQKTSQKNFNQANYSNFPTVQHALKAALYHWTSSVPAQRRKRSWKTAGAPRFRDSRFMMTWSQSCLGSMPRCPIAKSWQGEVTTKEKTWKNTLNSSSCSRCGDCSSPGWLIYAYLCLTLWLIDHPRSFTANFLDHSQLPNFQSSKPNFHSEMLFHS